jgi:hypothetical protein
VSKSMSKTVATPNPQDEPPLPFGPPLPNGADGETRPEPSRKSPFEALESENDTGKRESIFRNLEALKIPPDDDEDEAAEEVLSLVPIRRPGKRAFRAHPDDKYQIEAYVIEKPKEKTAIYVVPALGKALEAKDAIESLKRFLLVLCIGKSSKMFFWPIPARGKFRDSGLRAVEKARHDWMKAVGDLELGGYQLFKMRLEDYGEPAWPDPMPELEDLLELAFPSDIIDREDHPELKAAKNV